MTFTGTVQLVPTPTGGTRVEPGLDQSWDNLTKLQWLAAVVAHETGLDVSVTEADSWTRTLGVWRRDRGVYSIRIACSDSFSVAGVYTFRETWVYLNGADAGARQARREADA